MGELKGYGLVRASKKTGKIDMAMTGIGCGMLQLWGLQNTPKSKVTIVFELETGLIRSRYFGHECGFPKVEHAIESSGERIEEEIRSALAKSDNRIIGGKVK